MSKGKLYLIPTTLGDTAPLEVLPISVKKVIEQVQHFIVENEKTARRFIKRIASAKVQADLHLYPLNKFTQPEELSTYLKACQDGHNMGVISEAGVPGVADPGAEVVRMAHKAGIQVVPLVGPSSILMALMASGMNGQCFAFQGYLPIDKQERKRKLKLLEKTSKEWNQAQIFIETPYRNDKMLQDILSSCQDSTQVCVAADITLESEYIVSKSVGQWKKSLPDLHKRPCIFIIQK